MVQWQNATFPRLRYGFDSRYPLVQIEPMKALELARNRMPLKIIFYCDDISDIFKA